MRWWIPLLLLMTTGLAGCVDLPESDLVVASYPVHFLAEELTKDTNLTIRFVGDPHVNLHSVEPSAQDLLVLRGTKLILLHGLGLEAWALQALDTFDVETLELPGSRAPPLGHCHGPCPPPPPPSPVPIPEGVASIFLAQIPANERFLRPDHVHNADGSVTSGPDLVDAHTWLDPISYGLEANRTAKALIQRFPEWEPQLRNASNDLEARLDALHARYDSELTNCTQTTIATNHNAYAYLARRYGFEVVSLHSIEPGAQPDPKSVEQVIATIRNLGLKFFFVEEGTNPDIVRAIRDEAGATIGTLHAMEINPGPGEDYFTRSLQNLEALKEALECNPSE